MLIRKEVCKISFDIYLTKQTLDYLSGSYLQIKIIQV